MADIRRMNVQRCYETVLLLFAFDILWLPLCEGFVLRMKEAVHKQELENNLMQLLHFCRLMEFCFSDLCSASNVSQNENTRMVTLGVWRTDENLSANWFNLKYWKVQSRERLRDLHVPTSERKLFLSVFKYFSGEYLWQDFVFALEYNLFLCICCLWLYFIYLFIFV